MMATEYGNELSQKQFHDFYQKLAERPILRSIYNEYATTDADHLTLEQFKAFLIQKQMLNVVDANVADIINQYEPDPYTKVRSPDDRVDWRVVIIPLLIRSFRVMYFMPAR